MVDVVVVPEDNYCQTNYSLAYYLRKAVDLNVFIVS
jgi:hypothetical protein